LKILKLKKKILSKNVNLENEFDNWE